MASINELTEIIKEAFADVPHPGGSLISADHLNRHVDHCDECRTIQDAFRSLHWEDVPLSLLIREAEAINLLSRLGYRYFLPAYLLAATEHYESADLISDYLVWGLLPSGDDQVQQWKQRRFLSLSASEKFAYKKVLLFFREQHKEDFDERELDAAIALFGGEGAVRQIDGRSAMVEDRWEFYTDRKGEHRWRRTASNGRKVGASSEGYKNKGMARANAERHGYNGNPKNLGKTDKFEFYKDRKGEHRWRRRARNGEIVGAATEGYSNKSSCLKNARRAGYPG